MSTFLQNMAPGIGAMAGGYVKGQAATLDKLREEEQQRAKDALSTYTALVREGWKPVDPKKGSPTGAALHVRGFGWLVPPKVDEEYKYNFAREEMEHKRKLWEHEDIEAGRTSEEAERKRQEAAKARAHEERMREFSAREAEARLKRAQSGYSSKDTVIITDKITKNKLGPMSYEKFNQIMQADPEDLNEFERDIQKGVRMGRYDVGSPTAVTAKLTKSPADVARDRQRREQILINANDKEKPPSESEMANYVREINDYLEDNETSYYTVKATKGLFGTSTELVSHPLPVIPRKGAAASPATVRDVKEIMQMYGVDFQTAVSIIFNAVVKVRKEGGK